MGLTVTDAGSEDAFRGNGCPFEFRDDPQRYLSSRLAPASSQRAASRPSQSRTRSRARTS
jgi:hypothetical protein